MSEETGPAQPMGEFDRLVGVLFDPKPAFADIAARPQGWWLPLLLLTALTVGYTMAFTYHVGWERFMREQIEASPRARDLPAEQKEQIIQQQARYAPIFGTIGSALAYPVITLVVAAAFLFVFNVLLGAELTFKQFFSVACYGFLPGAVAGVLALAVMFIKDPAEFDLQNPVASNLGAFLDPSTAPKWLLGLASSLDLFIVWMLLLLATGFSAAARKISWSKALTWVVATWVLWLVVKTGWTWIWS